MSLRDLLEQQIQQKMMQDQIDRDVAVQFTPSAGQVANVTGMLAPGAGIADAKGLYPSLGSYDQPLSEAFSNEPYPSMSENLKRGGFGGYFDASMQGLGVAGDALYAAPVAGTFLGATIGTGLKGLGALGTVAKAAATSTKAGKGGKGITALDETKKMLQADIDTFAKDDLGFTSPTMEALITKAPANLKGKQITEWAKGNANKGVKPKELEFLGLDEYVAANPNANVRETVEGISGNKVKVSSNIRGGGDGQVMDFDISTPTDDPLDGSKVYQNMIDDINYEIKDGDLNNLQYYADRYAEQRLSPNEMKLYDDPFNFADLQNRINKNLESGFSTETLDDVIDQLAEADYMENPYELIRPTGTTASDDTFAFGNDEVGYQLFVDGKRIYNDNNIAYSQTEAQIQLRDSMANQGYDMFRLNADDFDESMDYLGGKTKFKQYIDNSLPGGSNYREVVFNWDNAPVRHGGFDHFDDDNQIAHALIRDRKLADGTDTLHGDEIQSDLHTAGSKFGYNLPDKVKIEEINKIESFLEGTGLTMKPPESLQIDELVDNVIFVRDGNDFLGDFDLRDLEYLSKYAKEQGRTRYGSDQADAIVKILGKEKVSELADLAKPLANQGTVPNYPYKDDYFDLALKKMLLLAIEEGKPAISVSGSAPMKARYSDEPSVFYETLYDKKIPSAMKKLSNKYGGEFEKAGRLDVEDTFGGGRFPAKEDEGIMAAIEDKGGEKLFDANVIRITPEMKEKILKEGIQSFGTGGIVESGITHLNTSKKKTDGIAAIATA